MELQRPWADKIANGLAESCKRAIEDPLVSEEERRKAEHFLSTLPNGYDKLSVVRAMIAASQSVNEAT